MLLQLLGYTFSRVPIVMGVTNEDLGHLTPPVYKA